MHELTLCSNALEIMEHHARQQGAQRITVVWLEIGLFSCIEADALNFCFSLVCRGSMAENCKLHLLQPPATGRCLSCDQDVTLTGKDYLCPYCGSARLQLEDTHNQMHIKQIEVE